MRSSSSTDASASYAAEVARLLWPAPWATPYVTRSRHRSEQSSRDAYLFPSSRRPRLLVPVDVPESASMVRRFGTGRPALVGPVLVLLERAVRSRSFALVRWPVLRVAGGESVAGTVPDSIEQHLAACFGPDVRVGVLLGTRRVNQKPVLQVYDVDGALRGYVKVGHNPLTAGLVRREADALTTVGDRLPRSFRVPRLLQHDQWSGLEVLVISALGTDPGQRVPRATRLAAMREVAHLAGTTTAPLSRTGFWDRLSRAVEAIPEQPHGDRLRSAVTSIEQRHGGDSVTLGGWHGDWGSWNMGMGLGVLQLWDWERYDPEVPIGFDALHFAAQDVRPGGRHLDRQEAAFLTAVPGSLDELGVPPELHDLTLELYLLEIVVRYVDALGQAANPALERRTSWALSLLERLVEHPRHDRVEGIR